MPQWAQSTISLKPKIQRRRNSPKNPFKMEKRKKLQAEPKRKDSLQGCMQVSCVLDFTVNSNPKFNLKKVRPSYGVSFSDLLLCYICSVVAFAFKLTVTNRGGKTQRHHITIQKQRKDPEKETYFVLQ